MGRKKKIVDDQIEKDAPDQPEASQEAAPQPSPEKLELEQLHSLMKKYAVNSISDVENKLAREN